MKELNSSNAKKGWDAVRNDLSMDRMEKKLNQATVEIRNDFHIQQKKMEDQMKMDLASIKEMLQEIKDDRKGPSKSRIIPILHE